MTRIKIGNVKPVKGVDYLTEADIEELRSHFTFASESEEHPGCYYRTVGDEKEWINPPMIPGVEYRTTERWRGKTVYTTLIEFGFTTAGTTSQMLPFGGLPIRYSASANGVVSPYHPNSAEPNNFFEVHVDGVFITVNVGSDAVGKQCFVQLWYAVF